MAKFEVTLKQLRDNRVCVDGYNGLVSALKGVEFEYGRKTYMRLKHTEPIQLTYILESNSLNDALWCLRCNTEWNRDSRLFAVWCARQVQHLMKDKRSIKALDVAERYANGKATKKELEHAYAAAAAGYAAAGSAAAYAAAYAGYAAAGSAAAYAAKKEMFIKMCNGQAPWQKGK